MVSLDLLPPPPLVSVSPSSVSVSIPSPPSPLQPSSSPPPPPVSSVSSVSSVSLSPPSAVSPSPVSSHLSTKAERREYYMQKTRAEASYLFKYLILTQIIVYLEAGSIPCLLDQLSISLELNATQQGALGGVVYLALSAASPFCAFFLHHFNPRLVLGMSLLGNNMAVLMLAFTPTGYTYSANMLIFARAAVGFTQAFPCIYTPLWVDEYAPREKVAGWMSYLQGSVPMGVMLGYFAGTVSNWIVSENASLIQTWRWPFLLQFMALVPINIAIFFVPKRHLVIRTDNDRDGVGESGGTQSASSSSSDDYTDDMQLIEVTSKTSLQKDEGTDGGKKCQQENNETKLGHDNAVHHSEMDPPTSGRGGFLSARGRSGFGLHSFLDEAVVGTPMSSRSTTYHDEEDALLASASMYGSSNKRSFQQLLQNQQHQYQFGHCEEDVGGASMRRSMVRPPGTRDSVLLDAIADELENDDSLDSTPAVVPTSSIHSKNAGCEAAVSVVSHTVQQQKLPASETDGPMPLTYGALDAAVASRRSPRMGRLEAKMLEEEFMDDYQHGAFSDGMHELLHIPVFCLIVFGLTTVYFVVTGVQYWSTIFMIKSLHASKYLVNALFVVVSGTGPILGVFFGGWLIDRCGGYIGVEQRARALGICMILGLTAFCISAVATFFNNVYVTSAFLWLLLFFGGAILPACTGIFISVVPAEHRALASSFSVMIFNLFGYSLSPYLTGLIMEWVISKQGSPNSYFEYCDEACAYRIGFRFCLCWSVWSVLCIGSAWQIASRQAEEARQVQHFYSTQRPAVAEC